MSMVLSTLVEVCSLVTDGTHDSPKLQMVGRPFIKGKDISSGKLDFENCGFISEEDHQKVILRSKPEFGDTLFSNIGSVGDVAYVDTDIEFSIKNVALFKPNPQKIRPRYLNFLARSPIFQRRIKDIKSGSAQPFVGLETLRSLEIQYHENLADQDRVISHLEPLESLITVNERKIKVLEEMARRIYREWFVDFIFPGHEKVKMVDSGHPDFGIIPEGWKVEEFAKVFDAKYGKGLPSSEIHSEGPYPVYGAGGEMGFYDQATTKQRVALIVCRGNGTGTIFRTREAAFVNNNSFMVVGHEACWKTSFIFEHLKVCRVEAAKSGSAQPQLTLDGIANLPILVPSVSLIESYQDFAEPILDLVDCLVFTNRNLAMQRDLLLPKLISGEIDVSSINIDGIVDEVAKVTSKSTKEGARQVQTRSNH